MKSILFTLALLSFYFSSIAQSIDVESIDINSGPIEENVGGGILDFPTSLFDAIDKFDFEVKERIDGGPIEEEVHNIKPSSDGSTPRIINNQGTTKVVNAIMYPNPTRDYILLDMKTTDIVLINIFDLSGRLVLENKLYNGEQYLDLSDLNSGLYIILARNADQVFQSKIAIE